TQDDLIKSAIRIISDHGFEAATMQEVAREAGVTPGAIQHHFESKAALMMRVLSALIEEGSSSGTLWPSPDTPIEIRAREFVGNAWTLIYRQPRFIAAWNTYLGCRDQPKLLEHVAQQRVQLEARMHSDFLHAFPELSADSSSADFIDLVFSMLRGLGLLGLFSSHHQAEGQLDCLAALILDRCRQYTSHASNSNKTQ